MDVTKWYIDFLAPTTIEVNTDANPDFEITFQGFRNPRTFEATGVFEFVTYDENMNEIAYGQVDNIKMTSMSQFSELSII